MADPVLKIAKDGVAPGNTLSISNEKRLDITYIVTPNGNKTIRLVLPVFGKNDPNAGKALLYQEDWDSNIVKVISPSSGITIKSAPADKKGNIPPGVCDISISDTNTNVELKLSLPRSAILTPLNISADFPNPVVSCTISVSQIVDGIRKYVQKDSVDIIIADDVKQSIIKFTANKLYIAQLGSITLSWEVQNATSISIFKNSTPVTNNPLPVPTGTFLINNIKTITDFTLIAKKTGFDDITVTVTVTTIPNTTVGGLDGSLFNNQKIMGLYNYANKLYALIAEADGVNMNAPIIVLWETFDGQNWARTTMNNLLPAFAYIQDGQTRNIELDFAGSPGVVFNNQLYLIGGSRYDVNFKSNEVYCYDFSSDLGWQKIEVKGNAPTPRMGHACVVYNQQIWMIGGLTDFGSTDEVWTFDGVAWQQVSSLTDCRSMASVVVGKNNQLQLFGGFGDMPGDADKTIKDSLILNSSTWAEMTFNNTTTSEVYYNSVAAVWQDTDTNGKIIKEQFLFGNYKVSGIFVNSIWKLNVNGIDFGMIQNGVGYGLDDYWYNIQIATFKGVIWLCGLQQNDNAANQNLHYFVNI